MARNYTNTSCRLYDTEYCAMLNMLGCESCTVASRSKASMEELVKALDALKALMPEGGIEHLFLSDTCVLCKGDSPDKRSCYALLDLGNREPETESRNVLGIKTKLRTGSIVPVQLAACDACKKRHTALSYTVSLWVSLTGVGTVLLLSYRPLREYLASFGAMVPFLTFVAAMLLAWGIGALLRRSRIKRYGAHMHLDVMDIPALSEMREKGWFEITEKKGFSRLVFSKKRLKQGVFTGISKENV